MNIEIKKSVKPVNYIDAINIMEERLEQIFNNKEKELIWTLEHEEIYTAGTSYSKKDIIDKKRISMILRKIKIKSLKNKIDPRVTNRIWKNMIWAYIDFEKRNFKKK